MYLFSTGKVISAIGKCRRILVTVHATTDAIYTTTLCLQKRYQPVNEAIKEIQSRFNMSCCPMFITSISITIDSINERFPCRLLSARRRRVFEAATNFATRNERKTHEGYRKDHSIDRKTIAKMSQKNSLTHADEALVTLYELTLTLHHYCNAILAGAPKITTDRLQRVLNAAARVVSDTKKFDCHDWCTRNYTDWTFPSEWSTSWALPTGVCSARRQCTYQTVAFQSPKSLHDGVYAPLTVPQHRLSTFGRRAFAVAGLTTFNALPDDVRDPTVSKTTFGQLMKTHLFSAYQHV